MIARDEHGRPAVAIPAEHAADAWKLLEQVRHQIRFRGRTAPAWLDEMVRDSRLLIALQHIGVTDSGHSVAPQTGVGPRLMSVGEVASLTGRSVETIRRQARNGDLDGAVQTAGGQWLIPLTAIN